MPHKPLEQLAKVSVSSDGLRAELTLLPGISPLDLNNLALRALVESREIHASQLTDERIAEAIEKYPNAPLTVVVAEGIEPIHGVNAIFELDPEVQEILERAQMAAAKAVEQGEPDEHEDTGEAEGAIDHYERSTIPVVEAGQSLGRIVPAREGTDGLDVRGGTINARPPLDAPIEFGESVRKTESGRLLAANAGVAVFTGDALRVEPGLEIPGAIDFSVGNVFFPGDVVVRKGIRDRFRVCSDQKLEVFDLVEAAHLVAHDVVLHRGMAGREKGTIDADHDAEVRYVDAATCHIGRDLIVRRELTNCETTVGRDLVAPGATVMGGSLSCGHSIDVGSLGAESGTPMVVSIGEMGKLTRMLTDGISQSERLECRLNQAKQRLEQLGSTGGKMSGSTAEELTEIQFEVSQTEARLGALQGAVIHAAELLEAHAGSTITIQSVLHAGVTLRSGEWTARMTTSIEGPVRVHLSGEEPVIEPMQGGASTLLSRVADLKKNSGWIDPASVLADAESQAQAA